MESYRARSFALGAIAVVAAFCIIAYPAVAQIAELRGVVTDSANGKPVPAAVVLALDAAGGTLVRTITNDRGVYSLIIPNTAVSVRALRIGYRAGTVPVPASRGTATSADIVLATLPAALPVMEVSGAQGCPVQADRAQAFSLLEQARTGLLAAVVARENARPELLVLQYEKFLDLDGIGVERQIVRVDSSANARTSFNATRTAVDFVRDGFRSGSDGRFTYYGPDAEVLLDERFQRGYCFSVARADTARPRQAGVHFSVANRRNGRVDIDGTLWIDTAARALHDIEFRYVGIDAIAEGFNAGGRVSFRTLASGVPFIDQWSLRLVGSPSAADPGVQQYAIREVGGELARARWPDGETWLGPQSSVHVTAFMRDGRVAAGTQLNLLDTDYRTRTDSTGRAEFRNVLPGTYTVAIDDPALAPIGLQIPAGRTITVQRLSAALTRVTVPTAVEHISALCSSRAVSARNSWLVARVTEADGSPAVAAHWRLSTASGGVAQLSSPSRSGFRVVRDGAATGSDGLVLVCEGLGRGAVAELAAWRDPREAVQVRRMMDGPLEIVRVRLPGAVVAATAATTPTGTAPAATAATAATAADNPKLVAFGTVKDSISGVPITGARVTFLGTPFEGATDPSGTFVVGGLSAGTYTVEVSTPWLDSLGVVTRRSVALSQTPAPIALFVPTHAAIVQSACGTSDASGFVVGNIRAPYGNRAPYGLRVVAEWNESLLASPAGSNAAGLVQGGAASKLQPGAPSPSSRLAWSEAPVSAEGTYRVCGVPGDTRVVLRTESDSITPWQSRPRTLALAPDRLFDRVDLQLDSTASELSTLTGVVLADTSGTPMVNVEVLLSDLGRSALTDSRGAFRMSDVPVGPHLLSVRRVGFAAYVEPVTVVANQVTEQRVTLGTAQALAPVSVVSNASLREFEERRATGVGRFMARADLEKNRGRRLGEVLTQVSGFGAVSGGAGHMFVVGKRAPSHLLPRSPSSSPAQALVTGCGSTDSKAPGAPPPCQFTTDDMRDVGIYCPTSADRSHGIVACACYAQVYLDGRLMNTERPTEPFDVNTIAIDDIEGVEFYASAASTPGRYSSLNAYCGVMLVWTRR